MRNALQEFTKRESPLPTTILGLREHIFTASVSSLANYMALQETSFVTLGQRVLTKPLRIRLHYGHPDIFDKLFFITDKTKNSVVHGDFRVDNLIYDQENPENVLAVLDWELSTIGDPVADAVYACMAHHIPNDSKMLAGLQGR